jgi:hypothetical protein
MILKCNNVDKMLAAAVGTFKSQWGYQDQGISTRANKLLFCTTDWDGALQF